MAGGKRRGCQETVAECDCTKGGTDSTRHIMALQRQRKRVPEREERSFSFTPPARLKVGFTCKNGERFFRRFVSYSRLKADRCMQIVR